METLAVINYSERFAYFWEQCARGFKEFASDTNGAIDLTKERGVYNLYVQMAGGDGNTGQAVDVSANEMEVDESSHRVPGSLRQVGP